MRNSAEWTLDHVKDVVSSHLASRPETPAPVGRGAAVSVVVFDVAGDAHYCLMKRASKGRNAGQWALPGGKIETGESDVEAALREAQEEVSLPSARAEVLGRLDHHVTMSGFVMSPFVVAAPRGWRPVAAAAEVRRTFEFPVAGLLGEQVVRWAQVDEGERLLQMHLAEGVRIHAPTGGVLWQFRETALRGREVDVSTLRHPEFTRR